MNNLTSYLNFLKFIKYKAGIFKICSFKKLYFNPNFKKIKINQLGELIKKFQKKITFRNKIYYNDHKEQIGFLVLDNNGSVKEF